MRSFYKILLVSFGLCFFSAATQAQSIKLDETISCFNATEYPGCLFELVESNGFERIDKEYFGQCERVIYYYAKGGRPSVFFNLMLCRKGYLSEHYPVFSKHELEMQFQKSGRPYFETLSASIRKQCKPLAYPNSSVPGPKSKTTTRAYKHEASGNIIVIKNTSPIAYIYLLK
jgi:hypothetical protein